MEDRSGFSVLCLLAGISVTEELLRVIVFSTSSSISDHFSVSSQARMRKRLVNFT